METITLSSDMRPSLTTTSSTDALMIYSLNAKIDHEASFCHNSMVIWFHDKYLSMDIQRLMWIRLIQTFKCIRTFTDNEKFTTYLTSEFLTTTLKFIISGEQAEELCSLVKTKSGDYDVYELDTKLTQSVKKSPNTWTTFNSVKELFNTITENFKKSHDAVDKNNETPDGEDYTYKTFSSSLGIFNLLSIPKSFHFLDKESSTFLLFQFLNKIITHMEYEAKDIIAMWFFCRQKYKDNASQMKNIAAFMKKYCPSKAIYYYTEGTFLFRSLNEVFRFEDTNGIYKFRCYIVDLYKQLKQKTTSSDDEITLYRGKKIPFIVLQQLKELYDSQDVKDKLISINGFLSTTMDKVIAETFASIGETRMGYVSAIFIFKINRAVITTIPYADITCNSCFPVEKEFLFSMGSVWKLLKIEKNNDVWTIRLELSNIFDDKLAEFDKQLSVGQSSYDYYLFLLAKILHALGKYSEAGEFYHCLLKKELPDEFKSLIHFNFATMKGEQGEYTEAQEHLKKTITSNKLRKTSLSLRPIYANMNAPSQLTISNNMGILHQKKDDYDNARNSFKEALQKEGSPIEKAIVHNNLGNLENFAGKLPEAHQHLKEAVKLAENSRWSNQFKKDLENVEQQLKQN